MSRSIVGYICLLAGSGMNRYGFDNIFCENSKAEENEKEINTNCEVFISFCRIFYKLQNSLNA